MANNKFKLETFMYIQMVAEICIKMLKVRGGWFATKKQFEGSRQRFVIYLMNMILIN